MSDNANHNVSVAFSKMLNDIDIIDDSDFGTVSFDHDCPSPAPSSATESSSNVLIMSHTPGESSPLKETHSDPFGRPRWLRHMDGLCMIITSMIVFAISVTVALIITIYVAPPPVISHGGVVSSNEVCSKRGRDLLKSGSASTIDAAIATALCIAIIHPHAAGLGGGGFALVHNQKLVDAATYAFDFREMSSQNFGNSSVVAAKFDGNLKEQISGGVVVAVPGFLKGLELLHRTYGSLSWQYLLVEAATLARTGVSVSDELADAIDSLSLDDLSKDMQVLVTREDNVTKLKEGDTLKQPKLAETLEAVGNYGADAIYNGTLTKAFAETLESQGATVTSDDMNQYSPIKSMRVNETTFSGMKVLTAGPPSLGFALHTVMSTLSQYKVTGQSGTDNLLQIHRLAEALKYALSTQTNVGDSSRSNYSSPYYSKPNVSEIGVSVKKLINDSASFPLEHYLNGYQPIQLSTEGQQQVSAVGEDAMVVTISMSLGSVFGSKLMASGFVLNDAMLDFSWEGRNNDSSGLPPSKANQIGGGVRPMSSLIPVIVIPSVTKCGTYLIPGSTPGYQSLSSLAQVFLNLPASVLQSSINKPRIHQQLAPFDLKIEDGAPSGLKPYLEGKGHVVTSLAVNETIGIVDMTHWFQNIVSAFIDKRDGHDNMGYIF